MTPTPISQNGWTVLEAAPPAVEVPGAPGVKITVRQGDVATILVEVARRFHREVEPLDLKVMVPPGRDDWGWAYRPIRGKESGFSNHASGTAIDLNATLHPRGEHGTFSLAQKRAVRAILAGLVDEATDRPVVRWGEDYTTTVDGMHFEINAGWQAVHRVAERIRADRAAAAAAAEAAAHHEGTTSEGDTMITSGQLADLLAEVEFDLGPTNARLLAGGKPRITGEQLLVALAGHAAAQSATLAEILEQMQQLVRQTAPVQLEPIPGGLGVQAAGTTVGGLSGRQGVQDAPAGIDGPDDRV